MKPAALAASAFMAAAPALADVVAPGDVAFGEYGEVEASLTGVPGDSAAGREVFINRGLGNCLACHENSEMSDQPFHGEVGPMLDGVGDRWNEAELRGIVANAKMTYDGTIMPSYFRTAGYTRPGDAFTGKAAKGELSPLLSAQDIEDVVAFLSTLKE